MYYFKYVYITALLALCCSTTSFAETLRVVASSPVAPNATNVPVHVKISTGANTAGAAFTVLYDKDKLTYTGVTSGFFASFATQNINPGTVTVGPPPGVVYTQGLVDNPLTGAVMLAAAQSENGASGEQTLFTLTFDVKVGASGSTGITVIKSTITNAAAGYPTATEIPMLIGINGSDYPEVLVTAITPFTLTIGIIDTDNDGIDDNWEQLHFGNLTTANSRSDYDKDGYTDRQEFLNGGGYDPKVPNAPDGPGYFPAGVGILPTLNLLLLFED